MTGEYVLEQNLTIHKTVSREFTTIFNSLSTPELFDEPDDQFNVLAAFIIDLRVAWTG